MEGSYITLALQTMGPNDRAWHTLSSESFFRDDTKAKDRVRERLTHQGEKWSDSVYHDHKFRVAQVDYTARSLSIKEAEHYRREELKRLRTRAINAAREKEQSRLKAAFPELVD